MCNFITILVDKSVDLKKLEAATSEHDLGCNEIDNKFLKNGTKNLKRIFATTLSMCDCGTLIGSGNHVEKREELNIKKLKRKGWSNSKIERWKKDKAKSEQKYENYSANDSGNLKHTSKDQKSNYIHFPIQTNAKSIQDGISNFL